MRAVKFALVAFLVLGLAGVAEAAGARGNRAGRRDRGAFDPNTVTGRIVAVATLRDKTDTVIVLKTPRSRGVPAGDTAIIANADTKVVLEGQDSRLLDLKPGQQVTLTTNNGVATKVEVTSVQKQKAARNPAGQNAGRRAGAKAGRNNP